MASFPHHLLSAMASDSTVAGEHGSASKDGLLARKKFQNGTVYLTGKKRDKWVGRFRDWNIAADGTEHRVRREVILGWKKDLPKKSDAQRQLVREHLSRINNREYRPGRVSTFDAFIDQWKQQVLVTQQPSSARAVRSHLKCYITPQLGKINLDQFAVERQQQFITAVASKGVSRKTLLNVLGTLSSILSMATDWGYTCHPIHISKLRLPSREQRYEAPHFTVDQLQRIMAIAEEPWRTLYCILLMDGLRAGEALGLQWRDVDFERRLLHIRRSAWCGHVQTVKTKSSETALPMPEALVTILKAHQATSNPNPDGFLFVTRNGRPPSSNKVVEYHLWTVLDALGIPRCGLHAFRHTHTALLLDSGATPKVVQRQLRHADARTTLQIYGHVVGDAHREAVEKISHVVDGSGRELAAVN